MVSLSSTHLDIIGSYLNSQKLIYLESSHYTSKWLNMLMIPLPLVYGLSQQSGPNTVMDDVFENMFLPDSLAPFISLNVDAGTSGYPTPRLFINSVGNVGIGTTAPESKLHVNGDIRVTGDIQADGAVMIRPTTRYLIIGAGDMVPQSSSTCSRLIRNSRKRFCS